MIFGMHVYLIYLSVGLCCRPPTTASGSSEERRPDGAATGGAAAAAAGTEGTAGDAWRTSEGVLVSVPFFFSPPKSGTKRLCSGDTFCLGSKNSVLWACYFFGRDHEKWHHPELDKKTYFLFKEIHETHNHNNNNLHFPFRRRFLEGQKCVRFPESLCYLSRGNYPPRIPQKWRDRCLEKNKHNQDVLRFPSW